MAKELLQDITIRSSKPKEKDYRLSDGDGLYILIKTTNAKWWRLDYTFNSTRKTISLGTYPETGLKTARTKATIARENIANNIDPSDLRKEKKITSQKIKLNAERSDNGLPAINSFADVAMKWLFSTSHLTSETTHSKKTSRLERHAFPTIGNMQLTEIKSSDILHTLQPLINKLNLETAHRLHGEISSIFSYAIVHNLTDYDPSQPVAKQIPAQKVKHRAAIIDPKLFGNLLRAITNYHGTFVVQNAFRLSPHLFQRPGEIRQMLWSDIDLIAAEWKPYVSKTDFYHIVPLSDQAIRILKEIKPLTGRGTYVFPSIRGDGRPMSDGTIRTALKCLGYNSDIMTAHGFRTTASTLLNEQGWSPDAIERQLAHSPRDKVRAAYNRAQYLEERRRMMQSWSNYLDRLIEITTIE
jgi:integrase